MGAGGYSTFAGRTVRLATVGSTIQWSALWFGAFGVPRRREGQRRGTATCASMAHAAEVAEARRYLSEKGARIVFLDVDGVLHPTLQHGGRQENYFCQAAQLERIIQQTGARVVLISTWRLHAESRERVEKVLRDRGLPPLLHVTPSNTLGARGGEIMDWLVSTTEGLPPPQWVVLDDEPLPDLAKAGAGAHHVRPSASTGLSDADSHAAVDILMKSPAEGLGFRHHHNAILRTAVRLFE